MLIAIDIGSSSVKAAVLRGTRAVSDVSRCAFPTRYESRRLPGEPAASQRAEIDAATLLAAVSEAIGDLPRMQRRAATHLAISVMSPAWIAVDRSGRALTPLITHQDRRSVAIAREIEKTVGKARHLRLAGNRPFPGGISSTTAAWYARHQPAVLRRAALVGHLSSWLIRLLTGVSVIDPSNASFTGLYDVVGMGGWQDELCEAAGVDRRLLPRINDAAAVAGRVTPSAAEAFSLPVGLPVLSGIVDTSAALMLLAGATRAAGASSEQRLMPGQLMNVSGSTDVLALVASRARPHERLLTRCQGVGRRWLSVSTLAAAGSAVTWAHETLFPDLSPAAFYRLVRKLAVSPEAGTVTFSPHLAGQRTSIEQQQGGFGGLTLATTRTQMLSAVIESLAAASSSRLPLLEEVNGLKPLPDVFVSGGLAKNIKPVLYRDWPASFVFHAAPDATLRGLGAIEPVEAG